MGRETEGLGLREAGHTLKECLESSCVTPGAGQDLELRPVRTLWKPTPGRKVSAQLAGTGWCNRCLPRDVRSGWPGGFPGSSIVPLRMLVAPDGGVLEDNTLSQAQESGERAREGWVAGSDIKEGSRDGLGKFAGKELSLVRFFVLFF